MTACIPLLFLRLHLSTFLLLRCYVFLASSPRGCCPLLAMCARWGLDAPRVGGTLCPILSHGPRPVFPSLHAMCSIWLCNSRLHSRPCGIISVLLSFSLILSPHSAYFQYNHVALDLSCTRYSSLVCRYISYCALRLLLALCHVFCFSL